MNASAVARATNARHCFVVPPLDGPITGGTLYNRELFRALSTFEPLSALELTAPELGVALDAASSVWVDSLYLAAVPELKRRARASVGLILHYLPSFVALGRSASRSELSDAERNALLCADAFLVTSAFMRSALEALVAPTKKPILVVLPGTSAALSAGPPAAHPKLRVVMIGNVVPGKGIEPWLRALAEELRSADHLLVAIIGNLALDPEYVDRCRSCVRESSLLVDRVTFVGALTPAETLSRLAESDLFVSASRMESYGIALNEARVVGVPILARAGGNAAAHVDSAAGGELVSNDVELAQACVALARARPAHAERVAQARAHAPLGRSWLTAAQEFAVQLAEWEK